MRFSVIPACVGMISLGITLFVGCGDSASKSVGSQPTAVATTGMVADLVRSIGGEDIRVIQLMGPGIDPHLYKPTRDDVQAILDADVVFYSGLMLEGKMADTLVKVGRSRPVYAITESLDEAQLLTPDGAEGHPDPHVWMDVAAWAGCLATVESALSELLPSQADQLTERRLAYEQQLIQLDTYAREAIATIPADRRTLVTSHDAFNYFGRAYGLEVLGVQGLSTESEAGLLRVNELVQLLIEQKLPAVFVESSVSPKNISALVEGAAAGDHKVTIGGELFSDAMGPSGTVEGTYLGMIDHNVTTVVRALGGEADACGFTGQLSGCGGSASDE